MEKIPSDGYPKILKWCNEFRTMYSSTFHEFQKNLSPNDTLEISKGKISIFYKEIGLSLNYLAMYFKLDSIKIERDDYCINIQGNDQRTYFYNSYNKKVIAGLERELNFLINKLGIDIRIGMNFRLIYYCPNTEKEKFTKLNKEIIQRDTKNFKEIFKDFYNEFDTIPENTNSNDSKIVDLTNIKPKILVLRELGIIDLLNEKFNRNNSKIAECIGTILNEKPSSIRVILSNINGMIDNNTNPEKIAPLENAIMVLSNLGCVNEVLKLQKILGEKLK